MNRVGKGELPSMEAQPSAGGFAPAIERIPPNRAIHVFHVNSDLMLLAGMKNDFD